MILLAFEQFRIGEALSAPATKVQTTAHDIADKARDEDLQRLNGKSLAMKS